MCWNRQTGTFEGRVSLTYGFKSHYSHQIKSCCSFSVTAFLMRNQFSSKRCCICSAFFLFYLGGGLNFAVNLKIASAAVGTFALDFTNPVRISEYPFHNMPAYTIIKCTVQFLCTYLNGFTAK